MNDTPLEINGWLEYTWNDKDTCFVLKKIRKPDATFIWSPIIREYKTGLFQKLSKQVVCSSNSEELRPCLIKYPQSVFGIIQRVLDR